MIFLMRILEGLFAGGVMVAALSACRLCSPSSSRSWRAMAWVVAAFAALGVAGFCWAAALKVSLRTALGGDALANAASFVLQAAIVCGVILLAGGWVLSFIRLGIPRFRAGSTSNLKCEAVALTVCVALLVTSLELPVQDRRLLTPEQRITLLDKSLRALEDGDREMPRDTWDPDYVVGIVGQDPQRLFRWVQQNTYWIPYHGVLRGAVGVLMDRQGNSLDRAMLLAKLLERAGYTVRLAHGELPSEVAKELLPELIAAREIALQAASPGQSAVSPNLRLASAQHGLENSSIEKTLSLAQQVTAELSTELRSRVSDQSQRLLQAIDRPKPAAEWLQRFDYALAALRDHWWVQQQDSGRWTDLDLLREPRKDGSAFIEANSTTTFTDVPADLYQAIAVRVVKEQESRGKLIEHTTLQYLLRPAELVGQTIVLRFWPMDWISDAGEARTPTNDFRRAALAQEKWGAALVVNRKLVASGLLLANGDDPTAQRKGGSLGGLADVFSNTMGVSQEDQNRQLSAVWIEYEIRVPGEKPRTLRRNVFDLIGPAARASAPPVINMDESRKLTRGLALLMRTEILPLACQLSPEFLMHLGTHSLVRNRELINSAIRGDLEPGTPASDAILDHMEPTVSPLYSLAEARTEWSGDPASLFVNEPQLLTSHSYPASKGDRIALRDATDIVANNFGVSLSAPDGFAARLTQGVLDTNAEALLQWQSQTFGNAAEAYRKSGSWAQVADASQVHGLNLPIDVSRSIAEDLSSGYDVVSPRSPVPMPVEDFSGWWRIDRATGTTLGVGGNGWGQTATEHETTDVKAAEQEPKFITAMNAAKEGFVSGYSFCVALKTYKTINEDTIVFHRHLIAVIGDPSNQRECLRDGLVWGIVSAVLSLFIVTMGPIISKWLTRTIPWSEPALKWVAGEGKPLLGNGGKPDVPPPPKCDVPGNPEPPSPPPDAPPGEPPPPEMNGGNPKYASNEEVAQHIKETDSGKNWAEAKYNAAAAQESAAETAKDSAEEAYRKALESARQRGADVSLKDPTVRQASDELDDAVNRYAEAQRNALNAKQELDKVSRVNAYWNKMQAPTLRLTQAEEQFELSLKEGQQLHEEWAKLYEKYRDNYSQLCGPDGIAAVDPGLAARMSAHAEQAQAITKEYYAAWDNYIDTSWRAGFPNPSPDTYGPTQVNPFGPTSPRFPNGSTSQVGPSGPGLPQDQLPQSPASPSSPSGPASTQGSGAAQQSSGAQSVPPPPPNPFATSVVGSNGAMNALGGGPK